MVFQDCNILTGAATARLVCELNPDVRPAISTFENRKPKGGSQNNTVILGREADAGGIKGRCIIDCSKNLHFNVAKVAILMAHPFDRLSINFFREVVLLQ